MTKKDREIKAKQCVTCDRPHASSSITATGAIRRCMACFVAYYRARTA